MYRSRCNVGGDGGEIGKRRQEEKKGEGKEIKRDGGR